MSSLVFDTETTGLPKRSRFGYDYQNLDDFKQARIVSISWIVTYPQKKQRYYIIAPENFVISPESIAIHGITQDIALEQGVAFDDVMDEFMHDLAQVSVVVAHNLEFDINVLKSEFYRRHRMADIATLDGKQTFCTMMKAKEMFKLVKRPRLAELHHQFFGGSIANAHNAMYDTQYCYECYMKLCEYGLPLKTSKKRKISDVDSDDDE